jgi:hypothetical protein
VLSTIGLKALAMAYLPSGAVTPAEESGAPSRVVSISARTAQESSAATIYCAACGRPVKVNQYTCPNCLKSVRAA